MPWPGARSSPWPATGGCSGGGDGQFGLTEVDLGLPLPAGALVLLRAAVGDARALEAAALGRRYRPEEALEAGFVQRLVPHDRTFPEALREAQALAGKPRAALREIRANLRRGVREQLAGLDARLGETFVRWWREPEVARRRDLLLQGHS